MGAIDKLKSMKKEMDDLKARIEEQGQAAFNDACGEVFSKDPGLVCFTWTQYTPWFNDGDACVFGVGEVNIIHEHCFREDESTEEYDDDYEWDGGNVPWRDEDRAELPKKVLETIEKVEEIHYWIQSADEIALAAFGDHVQVRVTREGVEVTEYEHD